jgi:hypothetical protein
VKRKETLGAHARYQRKRVLGRNKKQLQTIAGHITDQNI